MEIRAPSRVLAWSSELSSRLSLAPDPACTLRNVSCRRLCGQMMFGGHGLGRAPGSFLQLRPNIESLLSTALLTAPLVTKTCMPRQKFCLACLPSFRPGRWLRGSGQALSINFPNFRSGVRPAAPPPAPPHPLVPQGCLVSQSGSLCKFWGRGVRWAGLRTLV